MKQMWIKQAIMLFLWASASSVMAQETPTERDFRNIPSPERTARRMANEMKKSLRLSDKQYDKVYSLYYKEEKKQIQNSNKSGMPAPRREGTGGRPPQGGGPMGGHFGGMEGGGMPPQGNFQPRENRERPSMEQQEDAKEQRQKIEKQKAASQKRIDKKMKKILSEQQYKMWRDNEMCRDNKMQRMEKREGRPNPQEKNSEKDNDLSSHAV